MKDSSIKTAALAATAVLLGSAYYIDVSAAPADSPREIAPLPRPPRPALVEPPQSVEPLQHAAPAIPLEEPSLSGTPNAGFSTTSVFSAAASNTATPNSQSLNGPVTLIYGGSSPAFSLTDSGTNRALTASITSSHDASSTLYGDTVGSGAGVSGVNKGTAGPGGNFQVTNSSSAQAGAFASTNGTGPALLGTITNKNSNYPAVYGQSFASTNHGTGVEGDGYTFGVYGYVPSNTTSTEQTAAVSGFNGSNGWGVIGRSSSNGSGVGGYADAGYGVYASSDTNDGVYAVTHSGYAAVYADNTGGVYGVYGTSPNIAVEGFASGDSGVGVYGASTNGYGVSGVNAGYGIGVYGYSDTGDAGYFQGNVQINGELTVGNTTYTSDRNLKSDIRPIDGKDVLAHVSQLPISSWHYTNAPEKRHVGPMAQDFHAAFGLNGSDDTHISEVDIAGVSLAAIQELNSQMKAKDAEITELKRQAAELEEQTAHLNTQSDVQTQAIAEMQLTFSARMAALERRQLDSAQSAALVRTAQQRVTVN